MSWQERSAEAAVVAERAGEPDADRRLLALLLDSEDTAVSRAAGEALLARGDAVGLRLFVEAFGRAEEDTRSKLGDCLYDEPGTWSWVEQSVACLSTDASPAVRRGAVVLTEHMTVEEQRHRR